jgi:hypothetical protein
MNPRATDRIGASDSKLPQLELARAKFIHDSGAYRVAFARKLTTLFV